MKVFINGEEKSFEKSCNLLELLQRFSMPLERVAIEVNKIVVRKKDWDSILIGEDDRIEVVHFVGGG